MTNFEFYTQNPQHLVELIDMIVDDALEAEGCSMNLKLPEMESVSGTNYWPDWLQEEYSGRWK